MTMYVSPNPGDLLLCYEPNLLDRAIDAVEELGLLRQGIKPPRGRPIYAHVAVYVGRGYVIEAQGKGLVRSPAHKYLGRADVWTFGLRPNRRDKIVQQAEAMLSMGYKYSYWDIAVQFFWLVFGLRIPWHQRHSLICSVFGYDCYSRVPLKIARRRNCAPEDIAVYGALHFGGRY